MNSITTSTETRSGTHQESRHEHPLGMAPESAAGTLAPRALDLRSDVGEGALVITFDANGEVTRVHGHFDRRDAGPNGRRTFDVRRDGDGFVDLHSGRRSRAAETALPTGVRGSGWWERGASGAGLREARGDAAGDADRGTGNV
jgi:hypothetical protein